MAAQHRPETIVYAAAFLEDYIEDQAQQLEVPEDADANTITVYGLQNEHRAQVTAMMRVVTQGVDQIIKENGRLKIRLQMVEGALRT